LDIARSKRFPVALIFNYLTNTQTRPLVTAGNANIVRPNSEKNGYWVEFQLGQTRAAGDIFFDYTFTRIEKDAVLTPFNYNEIVQQSDVLAHRFQFAYAADPRVVLSFNGIISQRPNGLLGVLNQTPPGSLNRPLVRLQFDTTFRF
ncbi:MAG: hypothetical protein H0V88_11510, partial [Pyrinomonadaceae bacterium]|nr:hypothetical protein [Pyrinomonadaceae bacterium]